MPAPSVLTQARLTGARSQETYEILLRAISYPGRVHQLPEWFCNEQPFPSPLLLPLAIADVDIGVWVDDPEWEALVIDATGGHSSEAAHAWTLAFTRLDAVTATLPQISIGTALEPESGARIALAVESFDTGTEVALEGPGINGSLVASVDGLAATDLARLGQASGFFPAGLDAWLFTLDSVMAIPRTTDVKLAKGTN